MVNMTIPTPMIIKTHAKTNPTVIGRLFDEENEWHSSQCLEQGILIIFQ